MLLDILNNTGNKEIRNQALNLSWKPTIILSHLHRNLPVR